jgi:hypothetical protein
VIRPLDISTSQQQLMAILPSHDMTCFLVLFSCAVIIDIALNQAPTASKFFRGADKRLAAHRDLCLLFDAF